MDTVWLLVMSYLSDRIQQPECTNLILCYSLKLASVFLPRMNDSLGGGTVIA